MDIVATSAGFVVNERRYPAVGPVLRHAMALTGRSRPRVCLLHTAVGDDPRSIALGYTAFAGEPVELSHLQVFPMPNVADPRRLLLNQDLIWVGGGSVANLLALWRVHELDRILRECWEAGVVLGGVSAGSLCWHAGGTTDSYGPQLRAVTDGLGLLPFSNCPHYDSEEQRRPLYQRLVAQRTVPAGWATDDGVGLHFRGTELVEAVSERDGAFAWRVRPTDAGGVEEVKVEPRRLS